MDVSTPLPPSRDVDRRHNWNSFHGQYLTSEGFSCICLSGEAAFKRCEMIGGLTDLSLVTV